MINIEGRFGPVGGGAAGNGQDAFTVVIAPRRDNSKASKTRINIIAASSANFKGKVKVARHGQVFCVPHIDVLAHFAVERHQQDNQFRFILKYGNLKSFVGVMSRKCTLPVWRSSTRRGKKPIQQSGRDTEVNCGLRLTLWQSPK